MNVGFVTSGETGGGIANYEHELATSIQATPGTEITRLTVPDPPIDLPIVGLYAFEPLQIRRMLNDISDDVDLFHLPSQFMAPSLVRTDVPVPVVVTVHDLIPAMTTYGNPLISQYTRLAIRGLEETDLLVSISEHTKRDILKCTGLDKGMIRTVYPSIDPDRYEQTAPESALDRVGVDRPYVLYVGSQEPRKNLRTLFKALTHLSEELSLVLAGSPGSPIQNHRNNRYIKQFAVDDRVIQTGYVQRDVLSRLYRSALGFVFPSKYEGFGRPPLEAMSIGTPVVCSNATSLPEVVDDAALLCDPDDWCEWVEAIDSLFDERRRRELSQAGRERVAEFSWERTARETIDVYDAVLYRSE